MKITFISNFLNHHQIPFSDAMSKLVGNDYHFISTIPISEERLNMGWNICDIYSYELKAYENEDSIKKAKHLVDESDVVIIGSAPDKFIKERLKNNKLTFKYYERLYKQGLKKKNLPRAIISAYIHHGRYQKYPLYMLCASAYTAADLSILGNYKGRTYKWGYFPEVKEYDIEQLIKSKRGDVINILWAGRFIDWKHPEHALAVAQRLAQENIDFQLKMIGSGEEFDTIKNMADNMSFKHPIQFLGSMSPKEVRRHMEEANIYLFTSDFNEGWGAVLNESMNSGCAVVASHAIGSVPFLLKHGENGIIYKSCDVDDLCKKVKLLAKDNKLREKLGGNSYLTIKNKWNAKVAGERFIKLIDEINKTGKCNLFDDGPCSMAEIMQNNWFEGEISNETSDYDRLCK